MTDLEVEAAMCLWEAFLRADDDGLLPANLRVQWEDVGTSVIRCMVRDIAPEVEALWLSLNDAEQWDLGPFDWEFCPLIVSLMTDGVACPSKELVINALTSE